MKPTIAAAFFAVMITTTAHAEAPLIIIDRWWGVDYAKEVAEYRRSNPPEKARRLAIRKEPRATTDLN
jgi:hypothetical protein